MRLASLFALGWSGALVVVFWCGVLRVAPFPPDEVSKNDYICEWMRKKK